MADHDANAKAVVQRFLDGEYQKVGPAGNQPLEARTEGGVKVFVLTIDKVQHRIDAQKDPVDALGFNSVWPGPLLRVTEGDTIRATFRNNLDESTGIHFHGQALPNAMDGVPHVTQEPILPGDTFTYEFVAKPSGSHMYHSHHNATDQVGRGLLGAFIVDPKDAAARYRVDQDVIWISNDTLGGFTINGRGFPATAPIVAKLGQKVLIRFMNEGIMMHPWHLHGMPMRVVARDGIPASAGTSSSPARTRAPGPSTATSFRMPRGARGCSVWSPRSSSNERQGGHDPPCHRPVPGVLCRHGPGGGARRAAGCAARVHQCHR